ncbi:MAG TPA: c-type cytochrome [Burkholderiales bacterium]|nr:c-type cytochrome [Burkholderiales bacterium]
MRNIAAALVCAALIAPAGAQEFPSWAYPVNPPGLKPAPDDGSVKRVPGSEAGYTLTQIRDLFSPPDWHPGSHPAMPEVVGHGKKPGQFACAYCHLPNGLGRPENSSLAGLPASYIFQQVMDFKSGARRSSEPASLPVNFMVAIAQVVSEEDARIAAEYFSSLQRGPWIRVVEADTVPRTKVGGWMLIEDGSGQTEAIGRRIIEMPEDLERTELRDARASFVAYVPPGSVRRGGELAAGAGGKWTPCAACHGEGLKGMGPVPALAGRSPSYLVRQLYDIRHGTRHGQWTELMKPVVAPMSQEDMVALAAYAASLEP